MAKRKAFLHVGLHDGSGTFIEAALLHHRHSMAALGVRYPAESRDELFRAAVEIRRQHKSWDYKRREVEGAWSGICRRALKSPREKSRVVLSQPLLAGAAPDQIALLLDQLPDLDLNIVLTVGPPDGWAEPGDPDRDLGSALTRWGAAVKSPDRLHIIVATPHTPRETIWREFGLIAGFGTTSLDVTALDVQERMTPPRPLTAAEHERLCDRADTWAKQAADCGYAVRGTISDLVPARMDPATDQTEQLLATHDALARALHEIERLARRNESLEALVAHTQKKRAKLKRRLAAA